jgi:hypothetical protein
VGVHFLGQFAGEFDRLDLGAEGAAEDALDQAFDAGLEVAQEADLIVPFPVRVFRPRGGEPSGKS